MKALELLKFIYKDCTDREDKGFAVAYPTNELSKAVEELESFQAEYKKLNEYYWFARNHLESYRCKCGSLGKVGYLCSNKECSEV